jgi:perosamine synthetase
MELSLYKKLFYKSIFKRTPQKNDKISFTFNSARASIYHYLKFKKVSSNDEIIVSAFTCDAVTSAVKATGAKCVLVDINDDISMSFEDILLKINTNTKVIICQNSFGNIALTIDQIKQLRSKGISLLLDNCLSNGSDYKMLKLNYYDLFEATLYSLEVSKIITIGWGGIITFSNQITSNRFLAYYHNISQTSLFQDLRRVFQVLLNLFFVGNGNIFTKILWYFFFGSRIFIKSSHGSKDYHVSAKRMGKVSKNIYLELKKYEKNIIKKSKENYNKIVKIACEEGYNVIVNQKSKHSQVSCRVPILINPNERDFFIEKALNDYDLEIGKWFEDLPIENYSRKNLKNVSRMNKSILNIPSYWTFDSKDISIIKSFLSDFKIQKTI